MAAVLLLIFSTPPIVWSFPCRPTTTTTIRRSSWNTASSPSTPRDGFYNNPMFSSSSSSSGRVLDLVSSSSSSSSRTQTGVGGVWCSSLTLKTQRGYPASSSNQPRHHSNNTRKLQQQQPQPSRRQPPSPSSSSSRQQQTREQQRQQQFLTVTDILNDYVQNRNRLQPYQVGLVWNKLGKAVQQSRNNSERRDIWVNHETSLRILVVHTMQSVNDFNGQSTATVTHSLAKLSSLTDSNLGRVQALWNALLVRTVLHLKSDNLNAQRVSNILWAYTKAAQTHPRLLDALANTAMLHISEFQPQHLSNVAWAFATLKHEAPALFDAIARTAQERIGEFKPQELSNAAWAFATLKHKAPSLFGAISAAAQVRIDKFLSAGACEHCMGICNGKPQCTVTV
jgi:hypothetical protein